jgi:hypothetical protein
MKTLYVAEINGRGIAAFNATDELMAKKFVKQELFETELMMLENDGARTCGSQLKVQTARS